MFWCSASICVQLRVSGVWGDGGGGGGGFNMEETGK